MLKVLACMAVGVFLGFKVVPEKYQKFNGMLQYVLIAVLIFCMGAGLGSNPAFFQELQSMGFQALLFAIIPIVCSVLGVYFITKLVFKEKQK